MIWYSDALVAEAEAIVQRADIWERPKVPWELYWAHCEAAAARKAEAHSYVEIKAPPARWWWPWR